MRFTSDQVLALAPDPASAANGKKLASTGHWSGLGQNAEALWGECQGSALYQVRVDLANAGVTCSCPSHKFPCKHGIALMLLAADGNSVPTAESPEWVIAWLAKRAATRDRAQEKTREQTQQPPVEAKAAARARRARQRESQVGQGLDTLDLWMSDLMRTGLASVEQHGSSFWERQAAQLVDAQAGNIATRIRQLAEIPGSSPRWPDHLLGQLGKIALLTHAYRRRESFSPALQADLRQLVDERLQRGDVTTHGDLISDDWLFLGQIVEEENNLRSQRTWCAGVRSGRHALILQHAFRQAPFAEMLIPGTRQGATLAFFPGAAPLRAQIESRASQVSPIASRLPGHDSIDVFLTGVVAALARQPWQERFLCLLRDVTLVPSDDGARWRLRDAGGAALPLAATEHWRFLALSGGHPIDIAGEWDGQRLRLLGIATNAAYYPSVEGA